jgi:transposase
MDSVVLAAGPIHLGLDVSKNKIAVGILRWDERVPDTEMIFNDEASVRRLVNRFGDPGGLRVCYEAGPTGFGLYRLLGSMGVACDVVAPALIPKAPGDRVKTDRRDCRRLARLHRGRGAGGDPGSDRVGGGGAGPVPGPCCGGG